MQSAKSRKKRGPFDPDKGNGGGVETKPKPKEAAPPPPKPPTEAELDAAGYELDATPEHNANCDASARSQRETNAKWNKQHYEGYQNAVNNAKTNGGNPPPVIEPPVLNEQLTPYDQSKPYYRLEDENALRVICQNDKKVPYPPDDWNWSKVF
jgi:hypothetical protein